MASGGDGTRDSLDPEGVVRKFVATPTYDNPLAGEIAEWLAICQRTAKALKVYDRNNAMIVQFTDRAHAALTAVFEKIPEILLTVRDDRFRWERDSVLITTDRQEGLPCILYRNSFRRLTFEKGMTKEELTDFLAALTVDFSSFEQKGEDILTILWRLKLPHLRYFTIDALTATKAGTAQPSEAESEEIDRIQGDIDGLVARIYAPVSYTHLTLPTNREV